jgi:hypothetical protein
MKEILSARYAFCITKICLICPQYVRSVKEIIIIIIIQFNLYYLCAETTAVRPITDTAQCTYNYIVDQHNIESKVNYK